MFGKNKKNEEIKLEVSQNNTRPERRCMIYISSKFKQIIFVPMVQIYC